MENKFNSFDIVNFKSAPNDPYTLVSYDEVGTCLIRDKYGAFNFVSEDDLEKFDIDRFAKSVAEGTKNELFGSIHPTNALDIDGYGVEIVRDENLILLIMRDASGKEVARSHSHVIHLGTAGVLQAISYAMKRLYDEFLAGDGGQH